MFRRAAMRHARLTPPTPPLPAPRARAMPPLLAAAPAVDERGARGAQRNLPRSQARFMPRVSVLMPQVHFVCPISIVPAARQERAARVRGGAALRFDFARRYAMSARRYCRRCRAFFTTR
jgi:hypothetical protein